MQNIKKVSEFIKANDKNSDILDMVKEYNNNELPKEVLYEVFDRELSIMLDEANTEETKEITSYINLLK